jgi:acyl-CoA thioester hydrolase
MAGVRIHATSVPAEWVDYNGHLRDAYYALIVSHAADALMDRLRLDASYRARTHCTLYTLEMHVNFLHEVKEAETIDVSVRLLGADSRRLHVAFELTRAAEPTPAATAELMLLHVEQGASVTVRSFPSEVRAAIEALREATQALPAGGPGSRRIALRPPE